jgi:predicted Ser/Thr protein kinase
VDRDKIIQHAQSTARQLVRLGLADIDLARKHFQDFLGYVEEGYGGTFGQILHARGVIDDQGLQLLNRIVPLGDPADVPLTSPHGLLRRAPGGAVPAALPRGQDASATQLHAEVIPAALPRGQDASATQLHAEVIRAALPRGQDASATQLHAEVIPAALPHGQDLRATQLHTEVIPAAMPRGGDASATHLHAEVIPRGADAGATQFHDEVMADAGATQLHDGVLPTRAMPPRGPGGGAASLQRGVIQPPGIDPALAPTLRGVIVPADSAEDTRPLVRGEATQPYGSVHQPLGRVPGSPGAFGPAASTLPLPESVDEDSLPTPERTLIYGGADDEEELPTPERTLMFESEMPPASRPPTRRPPAMRPPTMREPTMILPDDELPQARQRSMTESVDDDLFFPELLEAPKPPAPRGPALPNQHTETARVEAFNPVGNLVASTASGGDSGGDSRPDSGGSSAAGDSWISGSTTQAGAPPKFLVPEVGGTLSHYHLDGVIGQGGMGVVFRARHQTTGQVFALKALRVRAGAKTEKRRRRFQREVEAMQRLDHPSIVHVHGHGRDGEFDWYVMDLIEGRDLATIIVDDELDLSARLTIFAKICGGLVHAHDRGVIHRDLKPQNVLITPDNEVAILDFGLAKILDGQEGLTHTGSALGTPFYMSPEQVADPRNVGPPSDIFALGVLLYELITGQRPFLGQTAGEVGNKILTLDPPKPSKLNPKLSADLDAICLKAMEKAPARRYPSVGALLQQVDAHRAGHRVRGENQLVGGLRRFWERNHKGIMAGVGVASLFFVMFLLMWVYLSR